MTNVRNTLKTLAATLACICLLTTNAFSAGVAQKLPTDVIQFGKFGSASDKQLIFDFGLGASNPFVSGSSTLLKYSKNGFSLGDGTNSTKNIFANIGGSNPFIQYNASNGDWEFSNDGVNATPVGSGSGASGIQLLTNPGFESGVTLDWTNTGGTFVASSSSPLVGRQSALFTASANNQSFQSGLHSVPLGLQGQACVGSLMYVGGDTNLTFQVLDNSSNVLATKVLVNASVATTVNLPFLCPSSGSVQLKVKSSNAATLIKADNMFLGQNTLIQVGQSGLFGSVTYDTGCAWGMSANSSFVAMTDGGACTSVVHGGLSNPTPTTLGFTLSNAPAGEYDISVRGAVAASSSSHVNTACAFNAYDTTLSVASSSVLVGVIPTASGNPQAIVPMMNFHQSYSQAGNHVIEIHGASHDGYEACTVATADGPVGPEITVTYHPAASQIVSQTTGQAATWGGWLTTSVSGWTTSSTSITDLTASGTLTVNQNTNRNFGSVVGYGTRPGVTFGTIAGHEYDIRFAAGARENTPGEVITLVLTDGTNIIARQVSGSNNDTSVSLQGHWIAPSTGSSNIWIQGSVSNGSSTGYLAGTDNRIDVSITDITQPGPTFVLPGNVQTPGSGQTNMVSVSFAGNSSGSVACSSDPCTIISQSGGVTAVNWPGGNGNYSVAFAVGTFSAPPVCTCTPNNTAAAVTGCSLNNLATTSSVPLFVTNASGTGTNDGAQVICVGPK